MPSCFACVKCQIFVKSYGNNVGRKGDVFAAGGTGIDVPGITELGSLVHGVRDWEGVGDLDGV